MDEKEKELQEQAAKESPRTGEGNPMEGAGGGSGQTNRERLLSRLRERNADLNTDDEEALFGQMLSDYDASDAREKERQQFNDMLTSNPMGPELVTGLVTGKDAEGNKFSLIKFLVGDHGAELRAALEGDQEALEFLLEQEAAEIAAKEEETATEEELKQKIVEEDAAFEEALKEGGYKREDAKALIDWIYDEEKGFIWRARNFELTKDDFLRLFRIKDWDTALAEADERGYVRGKNEKIDMSKRMSSNRKTMNLGGGGGKMPASERDETLAALENMGRV